MPRKTLILIAALVLITVVLFVVALKSSTTKQTTHVVTTAVSPSPAPMNFAHSILTLSPNPLAIQPGQDGSVSVVIGTADNNVTAVQLELAYDPTVLTNVKVSPGILFKQPVVLINKNDAKTGRYTYAFGIQPNQPTVKGTGVIATVTFTTLKGGLGKQSPLTILPSSLVTARGIPTSVLKTESGTVISLTSNATQSPAAQGEMMMKPSSSVKPQ